MNQAIQSHVPQLSPLSGSHAPLRSLSTHPNHPDKCRKPLWPRAPWSHSHWTNLSPGGLLALPTSPHSLCLTPADIGASLCDPAWMACLLSICGHKPLPSWHSLPCLYILPSLIKRNGSERERCSAVSHSWRPHDV